MSKSKKENCFIIMPITTPEEWLGEYDEDPDHFANVLENLFIPAVKAAGFNPIPPKSKGSEVIQADIIKKIEESPYLLCDMSILNPNVFFELGIRTALNKPIALVTDELTVDVPFDTHIINHHTYNHSPTWCLEKEIESLSAHLSDCFVDGDERNSLWKHFSISARASSLDSASNKKDEMEFVSSQLKALRSEVRGLSQQHAIPLMSEASTQHHLAEALRKGSKLNFNLEDRFVILKKSLNATVTDKNFDVDKLVMDGGYIILNQDDSVSIKTIQSVAKIAKFYGYEVLP